MKRRFLAVIPARAGSKRLPNKNIRLFNGKPLIFYTIKQALDSKLFDRIIVDTDSSEIAQLAKKYGAEVPFLRPSGLAGDRTRIADVFMHLLGRLRDEQNYVPDVITVLQPTSPLREIADIRACHAMMSDDRIKSAATVCETSPWFWGLSKKNRLILINKNAAKDTNTQAVQKGYYLNGAVFMCRTDAFLKSKKSVYFHNGETAGVVCPGWRSVDIDYYEDWALAELVHKNKKTISEAINNPINRSA